MINKDNLKDLLKYLGFTESKEIYSKSFKDIDASLKVDFEKEELIYPEDKALIVNERQTCNFKANEDIPAYHIGKQKFSLNDLQIVSNKDIQGKYHEFATILRQHNVSGRENAFDKLVNLFLCKIVDEEQNPDELKFYWKGIAYDSYFDLQDRLQQLYQSGMKLFLGEAVTYIDNTAIDEAFRFFKNDPDATKKTIKKYFLQLKFFTNNDFAFIDVHNETLFYQNAVVLLKIVKMLQNIRLKTSEQNQFLGDMFEGFLDQGIKQSEGQFFTPMPIVKFILASLPLEKIIMENEDVPKVIDYACGAGHFLNEYALQIAPYVAKHKKADITEYYPEIVGIEKEYRLSKVAKVSAFMYGQDAIKIIYNDALTENPGQQDNGFKVRDNEYSVLVSNPPFSVKGFLETLNDTDRKRFELIETIDDKSFANNNSIEAFFIERAKQLLKPDGIAGIIVPSSILSKGSSKQRSKKQNVYVGTREIIIKYFHIIAIAEFGSGTFGKTGTNTVTLFLKRRKENPSSADHYKNRVDAWFKNDMSKDVIFADEHFIKKYCDHLEYNFDDYKTLLEGSPNENVLRLDLFKEYRKDFDNSPEIKNLKKQRTFKAMSQEEQKAELDKRFLEYLISAEKEKLYYFVLASLKSDEANPNPAEVVIVRTPTDNNAKKKFFGYEWSSAKGNEGIKYLGGEVITPSDIKSNDNDTDANLEEDDVRVLSNILNLNNIQTPLYDSKNLDNTEKINSVIRANFNGKPAVIPDALKEYVTTAKLIDMLDFSRKEFNKAISLTPKKDIVIDTKWDLVNLGDIVDTIESGSRPKGGVGNISDGCLSLGGEHIHNFNGHINLAEPKYVSEAFFESAIRGVLKTNDILICKDGALTGKTALLRNELNDRKAMINEHVFILRNSDLTRQIYLFNFLFSELGQNMLKQNVTGAAQGGLNHTNLINIKIPIPPLDIQKQIVQECEATDKEFEKTGREIEDAKKEIENKITEIFNKGCQTKKISDISIVNPSKTEIKDVDEKIMVSFVEMASVSEEGFISHKEDRLLKDLKKSSYTYFKENDIIIAKITPCMENGKCAVATGLTNGIGMGSSEFHVIRVDEKTALVKYVFALLNRESVRNEAKTKMTGSSGHRRVPASFYESFQIPVPDIQTQKVLVDKVEKQETKIRKAQTIIDSIAERKQEVIKKYL